MKENELLELAVDLARSAGSFLLEGFRSGVTNVDTKSTPTDVVTDADRDSEDLVIGRINRVRPTDGIISEEGNERASSSGLVWIVDPLDGTVNYLFGIPVWGVSIAVHDQAGALIGVVHDPNRNETFSAVRGAGSTLNGHQIRVSDAADLSTAMIGTGFAYDAGARRRQAEVLTDLLPRVRDIRRAGSAAIDLAWLACGRIDGFYEAPMKLWDRAAGELLIVEAGGVVTPLETSADGDTGVIAAGPRLHQALSDLIHAR